KTLTVWAPEEGARLYSERGRGLGEALMASPQIARPSECIPNVGAMAERIRSFDWANHPLGPIEGWPQSLKIAVRILLSSRYAMGVGWGPEFTFFCNDGYLPTLGMKGGWALGESVRVVWREIWADVGPRAESVVQTGRATWDESLLLFL